MVHDPVDRIHAIEFFLVSTVTCRVLFVFVALAPDRRRIVQFNVTEHPTAAWTGRHLVEACGMEETPRYLVRDRDAIYGAEFHR